MECKGLVSFPVLASHVVVWYESGFTFPKRKGSLFNLNGLFEFCLCQHYGVWSVWGESFLRGQAPAHLIESKDPAGLSSHG